MKKKSQKLKVTYKESSLPKEEKERLLRRVFDSLFIQAQKNNASKN